jgi:hypothetical protein
MTRRERSQRSVNAFAAKHGKRVERDDPCDEWDPFAVLMHAITASRDWQRLQQRLAKPAKAPAEADIGTLPAKKRRDAA